MRFIDKYFYNPNFLQKCLAIALLPISAIYISVATLRRKFSKFQDFGLPIISVGNLIVGGTGKTPFIIQTAQKYERVAVVMRGYKRKSKGLVVVSQWGEILSSIEESGDEAFLIAKSLKNASVIVCKKRELAVQKAKDIGAKCVFLDDGFRFNFKKLNIILKPKLEPYFNFVLPSGLYRELPSLEKSADLLLQDGKDYVREVSVQNPTPRMLLLTAIANPARLSEFLPQVVGRIELADHSTFDKDFLLEKMKEFDATSLLVTSKDEVKLLDFGLNLSVLRLSLKINTEVVCKIDGYIDNYRI